MTQPAHELIGHEGVFRLPGGRSTYEAVEYNDASRGDRPHLARLEARTDGLHQVNRYVDWDQPVEVERDFTAEYNAEREAELAAEDEQDPQGDDNAVPDDEPVTCPEGHPTGRQDPLYEDGNVATGWFRCQVCGRTYNPSRL